MGAVDGDRWAMALVSILVHVLGSLAMVGIGMWVYGLSRSLG